MIIVRVLRHPPTLYANGGSVGAWLSCQVAPWFGCSVGGIGGQHEGLTDQTLPIIFGCIDFYSAHYRFNASEAPSFALSLEQFAVCSEMLQPPGYCHGSLRTAAQLRNEEVCDCGSSVDLGFHISDGRFISGGDLSVSVTTR